MSWPIRAKEQEEADRFYMAVGRVVARWAHLEFTFGALFYRVTGLTENQAKHMFHSGRNWRTKRDILEAAIQQTPGPPGLAAARMALLDRAEDYYGFRNAVAHDALHISPIWVSKGKTMRELVIRPHVASLDPVYDEKGIERRHLENAAVNIHLLTGAVTHACNYPPEDQLGSPERLTLLVSLLPREARSPPPDPSAQAQLQLGVRHRPFPL